MISKRRRFYCATAIALFGVQVWPVFNASGTPAPIPAEGTAAYCSYRRSNCLASSAGLYGLCFLDNTPRPPYQSYCLRLVFEGQYGGLDPDSVSDSPEDFILNAQCAYEACLAEYRYRSLEVELPTESIDFSVTRYVKCESERVERDSKCEADFVACMRPFMPTPTVTPFIDEAVVPGGFVNPVPLPPGPIVVPMQMPPPAAAPAPLPPALLPKGLGM